MIPLKYVCGDATLPPDDKRGIKIIAHCCNDYGGWGAGFVLALSKRSPLPEQYYRRWNQEDHRLPRYFITNLFKQGNIQIAPFNRADVVVANMIAQQGDSSQWMDARALRYGALHLCLRKLVDKCAQVPDVSVHMPRIGCGLGGGDWNEVEKIIQRTLCAYNIPTTVYDLPPR